MSETPGPRARSPVDRERTLGDGAVVEDGVHVTDEEDRRSAAAIQRPDHEVAQPVLTRPGGVRRPLDRPPAASNRASHPSAISFTPEGEYEPQSTLTIRSRSVTNSS